MFLAVDDDRRDLLIEEDEDHTQHRRHHSKRNQPPFSHVHRVDQPTSVARTHLSIIRTNLVHAKETESDD